MCSALAAAVIGTVPSLDYGALASVLTGPVQPGPPVYEFEVWLASALLAVTFPFLAFHADFFQLWPLAGGRKQDQDGERLAQHSSIAMSNMGEPK